MALLLCALSTSTLRADDEFSFTPKVRLPYIQSPPDAGHLTIDPTLTFMAQSNLMSNIPADFNGLVVNNLLGADRFYNAGITGQGSKVTSIDAGHIWNGHSTLTHVTNFTTGIGALGETDRHATWVAMAIGGRKTALPGDYQTGIAPGTDLRSGAIATSWFPASPTPRYSTSFSVTANSLYSPYQAAFGSSDVINSSWGFADSDGAEPTTIGLDGLARANPRTTFVVSAGNSGPGSDTIGGPASGYNSIAVAALGNANSYNTVSGFSSRGPQDYSDPVNGLFASSRVAVDIAAPGQNLTLAYYGGQTGGNGPALGGAPDGPAGTPTTYSLSTAGTSFAAPQVAGGAALLASASYNTPALALNLNSRDSRIIKAVLLNSASKTPGWDNGQADEAGVLTTHQALDFDVGAGRMNLSAAYDNYLTGTTDVPGIGGGAVQKIGWDLGAVPKDGVTDYSITPLLAGGSTFNVTLTWFRNRTFNNSGSVSDDSFRDLDLEVWDSAFNTLIATSDSAFENVEHLSFSLPSTGLYGLRVRYYQTIFGLEAGESYGISWAGVAAVPEPTILSLLILSSLAVLRSRRRQIL